MLYSRQDNLGKSDYIKGKLPPHHGKVRRMKYVRYALLLAAALGAFALTLTGAAAAGSPTSSASTGQTRLLQTFTVSNTKDSGAGSLRQAILDANAKPGQDRIAFNIGNGGSKTIAPSAMLPVIADPVILDATSQPNCKAPCIELSGQNLVSTPGLMIQASDTTVAGLIVNRFSYGIVVDAPGRVVIRGNYIGVDASGSAARGNDIGLELRRGSDYTIGGTTAAERNVISGNGGEGIGVMGAVSRVRIVGNYIGLNAAGNGALTNTVGVYIWGAAYNTIGGVTPGERNIISGNLHPNGGSGVGVWLANGAHHNTIQGNYVGTNAAGTGSVPNLSGVFVAGPDNVIGGALGTTPGGACTGACNLLSGNSGSGLVLDGAQRTIIKGNFMGLNRNGNAVLPNHLNGIWALHTSGNVVGGSTPFERNVIAGNDINVEFHVGTSNNLIQGNYLGVSSNGLVAFTSDKASGVMLSNGAHDTVIGGAKPGEGNLIAGNSGFGVLIFPNSNKNRVIGNTVGLAADGSPMGNGVRGIETQANNTTIMYNTVAYSGREGVNVKKGMFNTVRFNSIFNNQRFGIQLGEEGFTPNDSGDADAGANGFQNFPVLTSASYGAGLLTIKGTLNSRPNRRYDIDLYMNPACLTVAVYHAGEGKTYLGSTSVTTDGSGNAGFTAQYPLAAASGVATSTATDSDGSTSEFSECADIKPAKPAPPKLLSPANGMTAPTNPPLLTWGPVDGARRYKVWVRQDAPSGVVVDKDLNAAGMQFTPTHVVSGGTYYWRVKACNGAGCGGSPWWSFVVP